MGRLARERVRPESSSCSAPLNRRYGTSSEDGSAVGFRLHRGQDSTTVFGPGRVRRAAHEIVPSASAYIQYRPPEGGVRGGIPAAGSVLPPAGGIPEHLRLLVPTNRERAVRILGRGRPRQWLAAGEPGGGGRAHRFALRLTAPRARPPPPAPGSARDNGLFLPCPKSAKHPADRVRDVPFGVPLTRTTKRYTKR